jgi:hypothetical protein
VRHLQAAVKRETGSAEAHAELGSALLILNRLDEAGVATNRALAIDDRNYTANMNLLRLHRARKDKGAEEEQIARLKALTEQHDLELRFLQRSIEVRPF